MEQRGGVEELLKVDKPMEEISGKIKQMVWAMNLYYWNVPLSRIGRWMGRGKSTIYGWVIGMAVGLWAVVSLWIVSGEEAFKGNEGIRGRGGKEGDEAGSPNRRSSDG